MLREWITGQLGGSHELVLPWGCVGNAHEIDSHALRGATSAKVLGWRPPCAFDANKAVVIGGICSIFTGDEAALRQGVFLTVSELEQWMRSWYPRIDQVHDAVGIPPRATRQVVYVCEDSLFARKVSRWTGLSEVDLTSMFKLIHEEQGHPVVQRWLRSGGYRGEVQVVYTSDLEKELRCALQVWKRLGGFSVKTSRADLFKVKMMYTAFWLDVLGIEGQALIYEPANHVNLGDFPAETLPWFRAHPFGEEGSAHQDLGIAGYCPFWSSQGMTRLLPHTMVPHRGNWEEFKIPEDDTFWHAVNFLFGGDKLRERGPLALQPQEVQAYVKKDLQFYYKGR